ncbi:MAG TPA: TetR/AcrR family transcriptional regulator [Candidatus Aquicultoraceae bacterium]|nr:TetR/AcrR family transcriptional regulator [Candidatus Aquicultoraceae bacterium]
MAPRDARSRILSAATPLFARHGLNGVSIRELASAAGVNLSMVSYHFGGKEGLYAEILRGQFEGFRYIDDIAGSELPPLEKFERYIRGTIRRYRENPYLLRYYVSELSNPTPCFRTIVRPAVQKVLRVLREAVEQGIARNSLRKTLNPADGVLALAGMINFYFLVAPAAKGFVEQDRGRDEELVRHFMDIVQAGFVQSRQSTGKGAERS